MDKKTGALLRDENEHIRQSVADILLTPLGSRLQRRDYGSQIPRLIDEPVSHVLLLKLSSAAVMALKKWEPRLQITAFKPQVAESQISATLFARRIDSGQGFQVNDLLLGGAK